MVAVAPTIKLVVMMEVAVEVTLVVPVHMLSLQIPVTLLNMELLREETSTPIVQEVTVMVRDWQEILGLTGPAEVREQVKDVETEAMETEEMDSWML